MAGLLVVLGFAACKPEEIPKPGCPPAGTPVLSYGVIPCTYESKANVPDVDGTAKSVEFVSTETGETEESYESE